MSTRDEFVEQLKNQLDELNAQVDEIEGKIQKTQSDVKAQYDEKLNLLRQQRQASQDKLNEIIAAGEDKWEALKDQAEHTWKAFQHSVNYFISQLK
jgi:chromosome segregation ATPase